MPYYDFVDTNVYKQNRGIDRITGINLVFDVDMHKNVYSTFINDTKYTFNNYTNINNNLHQSKPIVFFKTLNKSVDKIHNMIKNNKHLTHKCVITLYIFTMYIGFS